MVRVVSTRKHERSPIVCVMASKASGSDQATGGGPTTKKHQDEETQGLEKVTDYVEEKENSAELGQVKTSMRTVFVGNIQDTSI